MILRVHLFALARELVGDETFAVEVPQGATVADLRQALKERAPELAELIYHSTLAINAQYATDATPIDADAEVVLIPPVSGG